MPFAVAGAGAQHNRNVAASGTTVAVGLPVNPSRGSLIICSGIWFDGVNNAPASLSIQDANGNPFIQTPKSPDSTRGATTGATYLAYLLSAPSNADKTVTVTFGTAINGAGTLWVTEFTHAGQVVFEDDAIASDPGPSSPNAPTYAPHGLGRLVYVHATPGHSITGVGAGWTCSESLPFAGGGDCGAYALNQAAALAVAMTVNTTGDWDDIVAGFSEVPVDALRGSHRPMPFAPGGPRSAGGSF